MICGLLYLAEHLDSQPLLLNEVLLSSLLRGAQSIAMISNWER